MNRTPDELSPSRDDRARLSVTVLAFGISLGGTTLAFPLLALDVGLDAAAVGYLAALSAAIQMSSRFALPALLERFSDRILIAASLAIMALSASVLLFSITVVAFVAAQMLQGFARGVFWTATQTHSVRMPGVATRRLAFAQAFGQLGGLLGPVVAGALAAISLFASLVAALGVALAGLVVAITLHRLPPYRRDRGPTRVAIWRHQGVGPGSWASGNGGVWRGILDSFVPVILEAHGYSARAIGWLMAAADGSGLAATSAVARWGSARTPRLIPVAALGLAMGVALLPIFDAGFVVVIVLIVAGACGGVAGVLGTASVNAAVKPSEQGAALAMVGAYRAGARSAAPALVSALLPLVGLPLAMVLVSSGVLAPAPWLSTQRTPENDSETAV